MASGYQAVEPARPSAPHRLYLGQSHALAGKEKTGVGEQVLTFHLLVPLTRPPFPLTFHAT